MREVRLLAQIPVLPLTLEAALGLIAARDANAPFAYAVSINAQIMILASRPETELASAHAAAWLRLNDSKVLARLHRWILGGDVPVAAGSDITRLLLERVIQPEDSITLIGGGAHIVAALRRRFGLRHLAQHEPPMGYITQPEARKAAIRFVVEHPARFIFVATGAPRSELLLAEIAARGDVCGTGLAVGSGLLFAADLTPRAPDWMRRLGLEWLHRTLTDPWRLGRRYAADLGPLLRLSWRAWRQGGRG